MVNRKKEGIRDWGLEAMCGGGQDKSPLGSSDRPKKDFPVIQRTPHAPREVIRRAERDEYERDYEAATGKRPPAASPDGLGQTTFGLPSFGAVAGSFVGSMAKFASSGFKTVDRGSFRVRLEKCLSCEHRQGSRCRVCGCFFDLKARLPHEDCPIGRWTA